MTRSRPPLSAPEPVLADWLIAHIAALGLAEWRRLAVEIGLLRPGRAR